MNNRENDVRSLYRNNDSRFRFRFRLRGPWTELNWTSTALPCPSLPCPGLHPGLTHALLLLLSPCPGPYTIVLTITVSSPHPHLPLPLPACCHTCSSDDNMVIATAWLPQHHCRLVLTCPHPHLHPTVEARGYLCSQNRFLLIFRIPPVVTQAPIVSRVNPMLIQDLTIHTWLVPL